MKILDATVLIAFLREMDYPRGLTLLSEIHQLIVPVAVIREVRKEPAEAMMADMIRNEILLKREAPHARVEALQREFIDLGAGECECVALWEVLPNNKSVRIVSDDSQVRKRVPGPHYVWTQQLVGYMARKRLIDGTTAEGLLGKLAASSFYYRRTDNEHQARHRDDL